MHTNFKCCECSAWVNIPYAKSIKTVSCHRCGETYFCNDDLPPRKFYPALSMHPIDTAGGVPSKWMPTTTRPVRPGNYECRFRSTEPAHVQLYWTGVMFAVPSTKERVQMRDFLSWRGVLA